MKSSLLTDSASPQDVDVESVDRVSRRQQALAKSPPSSGRVNTMGSMDVDMGYSAAGTSEDGAKPTICRNRCTAFLCSAPFFAKMSCLSMTVTCTLLLIGLVMVVNALSAMNPYTIVSSQVFPSSDFVSLVKTVIEIGGTKSDVWLMVVPESALNQTFLVSDSIVKGDGVNFIAGMPGLTYSGTPFYFALDLDRTALNVYMKNEATRASSASNQQLLDVGADDTWLYSIPLHADVPGSRVTIQGKPFTSFP